MSISSFKILLVLALAGASTGQARTQSGHTQISTAIFGVEVAQTTNTVLSDSDIRRITHYSAQTMDAILAFQTGSDAESEVAILRQRVQRLVDAGQRSGISLEQTSDYFQAYLAENTREPLPGALLDAAGRFDARSLFSSTMIYFKNRGSDVVNTAAVDEADLAAIASVATRKTPQAPAQTLSLSNDAQPADVVAELPAISPDAPEGIRTILERVRLNGDEWVITVAQGDSLGQFANALYGDTLFFQRIYEANLGVLTTPNTISVGQELVLPKN